MLWLEKVIQVPCAPTMLQRPARETHGDAPSDPQVRDAIAPKTIMGPPTVPVSRLGAIPCIVPISRNSRLVGHRVEPLAAHISPVPSAFAQFSRRDAVSGSERAPVAAQDPSSLVKAQAPALSTLLSANVRPPSPNPLGLEQNLVQALPNVHLRVHKRQRTISDTGSQVAFEDFMNPEVMGSEVDVSQVTTSVTAGPPTPAPGNPVVQTQTQVATTAPTNNQGGKSGVKDSASATKANDSLSSLSASDGKSKGPNISQKVHKGTSDDVKTPNTPKGSEVHTRKSTAKSSQASANTENRPTPNSPPSSAPLPQPAQSQSQKKNTRERMETRSIARKKEVLSPRK